MVTEKRHVFKSIFCDASKRQPRESGPIVETRNGSLEGRHVQLKDGRMANVFLGIPYAHPPIGYLRFRKPVPLGDEKWSGIRSARHYGHRAVQRDFFWDALERRVSKSEDCLHLNVMAPSTAPNATLYPNGYAVMVYIHGGGFVMDSAVKYHYRKVTRSLVHHDVIVVTIQYRLSYLGFFCTGDDNAVGNYGLWDQVLALRWVHDNIAQFGGDPNRITVFGQSAGAVSADLLSLSPMSRDLVHQVILMGGNAETIWAISSKTQLVRYCREKALRLGFWPRDIVINTDVNEIASKTELWTHEENARLIDFLRRLPAHKFETTMIGDRSVIGELRIPITPVFDDELLPASFDELRAAAPPIHVIAGVAEFEGLLFLSLGLQRANSKFLNFCETRAFEVFNAKDKLCDGTNQSEISPQEFCHYYGITNETRRDKRFVQRTTVDMVGDLVANFALENYCRKVTANGSTVWRYVFEHYNPNATRAINLIMPFVGATHCTDLVHLFNVNVFVMPFKRTRADQYVNALITRMWTNFAKYGDPNGLKRNNETISFNINRLLRISNKMQSPKDAIQCEMKEFSDCNCANSLSESNTFDNFTSDDSAKPLSNDQQGVNFNIKKSKSFNDPSHFSSSKSYCEISCVEDGGGILDEAGFAYWWPYAANTISQHGYYAICANPLFRDGEKPSWQRARKLAPFVDHSARYDA